MSSNNTENYRPRSPDLSTFAPPSLPHLKRLPSFHENSDISSGFPLNHRASYDASPFFSPATATPTSTTSYFSDHPHAPNPQVSSPSHYQSHAQQQRSSLSSVRQPSPSRRPFHPPPSYTDEMARPKRQKAFKSYVEEEEEEEFDASDSVESTNLAPARPSKKRKSADPAPIDPKQEPSPPAAAAAPTLSAPPTYGIEVRTKFPVARIKRIMQADEDVGKVAQATPTAVSKALELFIISLVTKGAAEARSKGSKKVTSMHLKAALMREPQMDFLSEICDKVADDPKKQKGVKSEGGGAHGSSDEGGGGAGHVGKGKGTKRKSEVKSEEMVQDSD